MGNLSFYSEDDAQQTIEYLNKIGLGTEESREINTQYISFKNKDIIEFKKKPFIFEILEYNNLLIEADINYISEQGISFYIFGMELGDGSIFVPMDNINCIHTIEKQQIDREITSERKKL